MSACRNGLKKRTRDVALEVASDVTRDVTQKDHSEEAFVHTEVKFY